jgi:uncharacterized protein GlcG (DUF336 family)
MLGFTSLRDAVRERSTQPTIICLEKFKTSVFEQLSNLISKMLNCLLISVDSASKKTYCFLKMLDCLLISVDSASKKTYCFLKMLDCLLISVDSASKKTYCFLKMLDCLLISVDSASKRQITFYFSSLCISKWG